MTDKLPSIEEQLEQYRAEQINNPDTLQDVGEIVFVLMRTIGVMQESIVELLERLKVNEEAVQVLLRARVAEQEQRTKEKANSVWTFKPTEE